MYLQPILLPTVAQSGHCSSSLKRTATELVVRYNFTALDKSGHLPSRDLQDLHP